MRKKRTILKKEEKDSTFYGRIRGENDVESERRLQPSRRARSDWGERDDSRDHADSPVEGIDQQMTNDSGRNRKKKEPTKERQKKIQPDVKNGDSSDDDSDIERMRAGHQERMRMFKQKFTTANTDSSSKRMHFPQDDELSGMEKPVTFKDVRSVPSLMMEILDNFNPNRYAGHYGDSNFTDLSRGVDGLYPLMRERVRQHLLKILPEDPQQCCNLLIQFAELNEVFWSGSDTYHIEDFGLLAVDIVGRLVKDQQQYLETILKLAQLSDSWRPSHHTSRAGSRYGGLFVYVPKTMIECARILIDAGDLEKLGQLFKDFDKRRNLGGSGVGAEDDLLVLRAASGMFKLMMSQEDMDRTMVADTQDMEITREEIIAIIGNQVRKNNNVDWIMPLFSSFYAQESPEEEVIKLLTTYRDNNCDHFPPHKNLIQFRQNHCPNNGQAMMEDLTKLLQQFPFSQEHVLMYCEILIKNLELEMDDDESFDSDDDAQPKPKANVAEIHEKILETIIDSLDYFRSTEASLSLWTYLVESLKFMHFKQSDETKDFLNTLFEERKGWWIKQNFTKLDKLPDDLLVKKTLVLYLIVGQSHKKSVDASKVVEERIKENKNKATVNLFREIDLVLQRLQNPSVVDDKQNHIKDYGPKEMEDEWKKITFDRKERLGLLGEQKKVKKKRMKRKKIIRNTDPFSSNYQQIIPQEKSLKNRADMEV